MADSGGLLPPSRRAIPSALTHTLPDIYTSETTVLVDPQKVPEVYVKATVTGDVRNRLGTLQQQILSATRLQKIIDALNLYPEEPKGTRSMRMSSSGDAKRH